MSNAISLSASMQQNLLALQNTAALMATTQNKLATGLRVSSAVDDPVNFFTAKSLTNRASDLSSRMDGMNQSVNTIQAASKGIDALTSLVNQAKSLATQAQSVATGGLQTLSSSAFAGVTGSTVVQGNIAGIATGDTFTVKVDGGAAQTITIGATTTVNQLATAIHNIDSSITATWNTNTNKLDISVSPGHTLTLTNGTNTPVTALFGAGVTGVAQAFGSAGSGASVGSLQASFITLMSQIDQAASDAGYSGTNLLKGNNLTTTFNENGTSTLVTSGVTYDSAGLGFTAAASVDWTQTANINTSLTQAATALTSLRNAASSFGTNLAVIQNRVDFSELLHT